MTYGQIYTDTKEEHIRNSVKMSDNEKILSDYKGKPSALKEIQMKAKPDHWRVKSKTDL